MKLPWVGINAQVATQVVTAIPIVGINMLISIWLHATTGMYGTSLIIAQLAGISWWQGRALAYWHLGLNALGLAFFLFEGEGFAVNKATDAFLLITVIIASIVVIQLVGHLSHQLRKSIASEKVLRAEHHISDTLLREVTHRVGNDLATLIAIANLQSAATTNPETVQALGNLRDRIYVFSSLYRRLNGGVRNLNTPKFLEGICDDLSKAHLGLRPIALTVDVEPVMLTPHKAVIVGILLNESVTNALKYAFPDSTGGTITVRFFRDGRDLVLQVRDDGVGLGGASTGTGMGQKIMNAMSAQLHGVYSLERIENDTVATVRFPEPRC